MLHKRCLCSVSSKQVVHFQQEMYMCSMRAIAGVRIQGVGMQ